jgi:hypothetical protein
MQPSSILALWNEIGYRLFDPSLFAAIIVKNTTEGTYPEMQ